MDTDRPGRRVGPEEAPDDAAGLLTDDRITLWGLFLETHQALSDRLGAELEDASGIPTAWFEVLLRIGRSPGQAVAMTQLARLILFSSGGFTRLADRMEAAGLIARTSCPGDRRSVLVTLTAEGRDVLHRGLVAHVPGIQHHVLSHLDARQRRQFEAILRTLRDAEGCRSSS